MAKYNIVIGANAGDEGKGTIVARLAKDTKGKVLNVLTNGGAQRGHSVLTENGQHIFKHFGSATPFNAYTYFAESFILNPMQFIDELKEIKKLYNITPSHNIYRHPDCMWTTPYDMIVNQIESKEAWRGTCGMGIWTTIRRYNDPNFINFNFTDFNSLPHESKIRHLKDIKSYWQKLHIQDSPYFKEYEDAWYSHEMEAHFIRDCYDMFIRTEPLVDLDGFDKVIFENGQGLLLSDTGKDDSEATPSKTGLGVFYYHMPNSINKMVPKEDVEIHYVTRPYLTRHGSNNFLDMKVDGDIDKSKEINVYNEWQRDFMYQKLDLSRLQKRIKEDVIEFYQDWENVVLDVTHCDELDREREFKNLFNRCNFYGSAKV